jgi:hypothetical protein
MPAKMKNRPKITRVQLDVDSNEDHSLFGIVSAEPDYKLSLTLNKKLSISLKNSKPIEIKGENGDYLHFSRFSDHSVVQGYAVNLISNKSGRSLLLKKLNKIDYILQIHSYPKEFNPDELTVPLRSIDTITAVFVLETNDIRDKNLLYLIP